MQSCACGRSGGVCSDKFARMRQLLSVAAGLIGGRSNYARGLARRLAGPEASARRVRRVAASTGGRRSARVPDAGPLPCSAKGRRVAGAVPRDSVVCRRGRSPCASAWSNPALVCREAQTCRKQGSTALPEDSYIWRHAVCALYACKPARLSRLVSPRAPHATHRPGSPRCSHCQSSATRHPLRA